MSVFWGGFKSRKKTHHCIHEHQSTHAGEPAEEPVAETTSERSSNHVPAANAGEVNTSGVVPPIARDSKGRCQICRQEQLAARRYRWRLIIGIFFPFALQALDTTIVASALSRVASDFHELKQMNFIISIFSLCSATFIPFWGQIIDIFGRTVTLEVTLLIMLVGTAFCTAAPLHAFPVFILGRALQGLSVSGINVSTRVIMADKVTLKENAKNNSIFALFAGISYAVGPLIGGFLANGNWRWCFAINLPVAAVGMILVFTVLRPQLLGPQPLPELLGQDSELRGYQKFKAQLSTIDFFGQFFFLFGLGLLVLGLTWGGASYPWHDARVVATLVTGSILSVCFIIWQYLMAPGKYVSQKFPLQRPVLPWVLLSQRNMYLLFYINFATGMAITAVLYFTDFYYINVKGDSTSVAGLQLLYYTPGIGIGVYLAMVFCNFWPRQTFLPLFLGSITEATGISVLAWALDQGHPTTIAFMMGLTGAGTGLRIMPGSLHGIGFFPNDIAAVIAMTSFAVPFGGTLAMTLMSSVFFNKVGFSITESPTLPGLPKLPPEVLGPLQYKIKNGIVFAFISILPFMWMCVLAAASLGNVKITRKRKIDSEGQMDFSENTTEGAFLPALLRRRLGRKKREVGTGVAVQTEEEKAGDQVQITVANDTHV